MRHRVSRGFSLVELLVVVGIITLLAGILLPAVNKARESAKRIQCMSNVRQLTVAWLTYANDNKGHICTSEIQGVSGLDENQVLNVNHWLYNYDDNMTKPIDVKVTFPGVKTPPNVFWSWAGGGGKVSVKRGVLWPYVQALGVYICPDDSIGRAPGYTISGLLAGNVGIPKTMYTLNEIRRPESTFVFIEAWGVSGIIVSCFKTPIYPQSLLTDIPGQFHKGANSSVEGTTISFADGHAQFWAYSDPRFGTLTQQSDISPNSPDLYQLEAWSGGPAPRGVVR